VTCATIFPQNQCSSVVPLAKFQRTVNTLESRPRDSFAHRLSETVSGLLLGPGLASEWIYEILCILTDFIILYLGFRFPFDHRFPTNLRIRSNQSMLSNDLDATRGRWDSRTFRQMETRF
jgi:hypothetical protein